MKIEALTPGVWYAKDGQIVAQDTVKTLCEAIGLDIEY